MLAKTGGAILFGVANAFVPVVLAVFLDRRVARGLVRVLSRRASDRRGLDVPGALHRRVR